MLVGSSGLLCRVEKRAGAKARERDREQERREMLRRRSQRRVFCCGVAGTGAVR